MAAACQRQSKAGFTKHREGYFYQLLSFSNDTTNYQPGHVALVDAVFKTQSDSIFWDSYNDLNDRLYLRIDSTSPNQFQRFVSTCAVLDSAALLIKTHDFFVQQFKADSIPLFCKADSVVKIHFKIKQILSPGEFEKLTVNLFKEEQQRIEAYFQNDQQLETAIDPTGFYWIERPQPASGAEIEPGDLVTISYEGSFLNGRFLEASTDHFEFVFGTPDQLVKGLNFVIGKLKANQTAKILLSSRLAFGERGSSNGIVPPCTPLIYKIKIIDVKKTK